jgi:transposase-like protein
VFAGIQRRRRYTAEQKMSVVQEAMAPGMTISYVARRHGIAPSLIFGWRRRMSEGGKVLVFLQPFVDSHTIALDLALRIVSISMALLSNLSARASSLSASKLGRSGVEARSSRALAR